ncbi:MAG: hypothetical protein ACRD1A_04325 [Terriglobales bacterium]
MTPPPGWNRHLETCRHCQADWERAARSRVLLASLRAEPDASATEPDPWFARRVLARIERESARPGRLKWKIAGRELALASMLFAATLGTFIYDFHRVERPNADEAIVLDVPHLNPMHPADSHLQPRMSDVMLNLMNP